MNGFCARSARVRAFASATLVLLAAIAGVTGTASAAGKQPTDYVVASFTIEGQGPVFTANVFSIDARLCVPPPGEGCSFPDRIDFSPLVAGATISVDASSFGFATVVRELTDGRPGTLAWFIGETPHQCGSVPGIICSHGGFGIFGVSERALFGSQIGPNGVDLAGYTIDRIGVRVDALTLTPLATTTTVTYRLTFLFEGRIASPDTCKNGGWQALHGPAGSSFKNQGQCVSFVNTGRTS